jgi:DnaJ-class molecular chaperone
MNSLKSFWLLAIAFLLTSTAHAHSAYDACPECNGSGEIWDACGNCGGSGGYPDFIYVACGDCSGTGEISEEACANCDGSGETIEEIWVSCSHCEGSGISSAVCPTCDGSGVIETELFSLLAFHCAEIHQKPIHIAA